MKTQIITPEQNLKTSKYSKPTRKAMPMLPIITGQVISRSPTTTPKLYVYLSILLKSS